MTDTQLDLENAMPDPMKPPTPEAKLVVDVTARFSWPEPPKDMHERIIREQADVMAAYAVDRLRQSFRLLVAEFLNTESNK